MKIPAAVAAGYAKSLFSEELHVLFGPVYGIQGYLAGFAGSFGRAVIAPPLPPGPFVRIQAFQVVHMAQRTVNERRVALYVDRNIPRSFECPQAVVVSEIHARFDTHQSQLPEGEPRACHVDTARDALVPVGLVGDHDTARCLPERLQLDVVQGRSTDSL